MPILSPQEAFFTQFEPLQKNRFRVTVDGFEPFLIKSVSIPTPSSQEIVIDHINVQFKVKSKTTFGDWSLSLYQAIAPDTSQSVYEWIRLGHESLSGRDGYADFYKKNITVEILSPVLEVVNKYVIYGAFIKEVSGLDFDMSADGLVDLMVKGACDYCIKEF